MDNHRQCPGCGWSITGSPASPEDNNWIHFVCASCKEDWYENIKYCRPEIVIPEELTLSE